VGDRVELKGSVEVYASCKKFAGNCQSGSGCPTTDCDARMQSGQGRAQKPIRRRRTRADAIRRGTRAGCVDARKQGAVHARGCNPDRDARRLPIRRGTRAGCVDARRQDAVDARGCVDAQDAVRRGTNARRMQSGKGPARNRGCSPDPDWRTPETDARGCVEMRRTAVRTGTRTDAWTRAGVVFPGRVKIAMVEVEDGSNPAN
jgi:hypothetical protein